MSFFEEKDEDEEFLEPAEEQESDYKHLLTPKFKEKFERKFRANDGGCFIWQLSTDKDDYGQVRVGTRVMRAHRVSYELYVGEIPAGMDIDHKCHEPRCVNPEHLEVVTHTVNMQRRRNSRNSKWKTDDDGALRVRATTAPEEVLAEAKRIMEASDVSNVKLPGNARGYGIEQVEGAPWRELEVTQGIIAQDKFAIVRLFLECVRLGVNWRRAADEILGISPWTVSNWFSNPEWAEDITAAKKIGRKYRYETLEEKVLDEIERNLPDADYKEIVNTLKAIREPDEAKKNAQSQLPAGGVTIIFQNADALKTMIQEGDILEAEFEEKHGISR